MAITSQISSIVASQLGKLQGSLESKIQNEVLKLNNLFSNECPSREQLQQIFYTRNQLLKLLNNFQGRIKSFSDLGKNLDTSITRATQVITTLRNIPIPTSVPPGTGVPIGLTNKYSELLRLASEFLDNLQDDQQSIFSLVNTTQGTINSLYNILQTVDRNIEQCGKQSLGTPNQIEESVNISFQLDEPNQEIYITKNGERYTLSLVVESTLNSSIPRRIAIARNKENVIVLKGEPSFSSSVEVLFDELKFRLEKQLA